MVSSTLSFHSCMERRLTLKSGFVYSQTNDRLWRKNRQPTSGSTCLGHDINRNWPYQWSVPGGASSNPCAQDFRGVSPPGSLRISRRSFATPSDFFAGLSQADAPETKVLSSWMDNIGRSSRGLKLYIDVHSYSQLFMTREHLPWNINRKLSH